MKINEREFFDYSLGTQASFIAADQQNSNNDFQKTLDSNISKESAPSQETTAVEDTYERTEAYETTEAKPEREVSETESKEKPVEDKPVSDKKEEVKEDKPVETKDKSEAADKKDTTEAKKEAETTVQKPDADKEIKSAKSKQSTETAETGEKVKDIPLETVKNEGKKQQGEVLTDNKQASEHIKNKQSDKSESNFVQEMESEIAEGDSADEAAMNIKSGEKGEVLSNDNTVKQEVSTVKKSDKFQNDLQITFADSKSEAAEQKEAVTQVQGSSKVLEQYQEFREKILKNIESGVKIAVNRPEGQVSIKLQPPELGRMDIQLSVKENGVSAEIMTENHAVKEVILTNLEQLKSNLENANLSLNNVDVSTGDLSRFTDHKLDNGDNSSAGQKGRGGKAGGGTNLPEDENQIVNSAPVTQFLGRSLNLLI